MSAPRTSIGGVLDLDAMAALTGRDRYRPTSQVELEAAIRKMRSDGLTARDIAAALRIAPDQVVNILAGRAVLPASINRSSL